MDAIRAYDLVTLRQVRTFIVESHARVAVVFFGLLYVLGATSWGGMLLLAPTHLPYSINLYIGNDLGIQSWNFPILLITAPWVVVTLPFFATVAMIISAIGVGYGMTVSFLLVVRLIRPAAAASRQSAAMGTLTDLTPAMISLVTLGACCSTTGVATAGVGLVAAASGTSVSALLLNNWYLGMFQVVIVWIALVAQELLLSVYGGLFGLEPLPGAGRAPPRYDLRFALSAGLRAALFAGGMLWALGMFSDWTSVGPAGAGAGLWFRWMFQHELLGAIAVAAALFPEGTCTAFRTIRTAWNGVGRAVPFSLLLVGTLALLVYLLSSAPFVGLGVAVIVLPTLGYLGFTWARPGLPGVLAAFTVVAAIATLAWVPLGLVDAGVQSWGNQVLGLFGAPAAWGSVVVGSSGDPSLYARWLLEYLLVGGFALAAVLAPDHAFLPLLASVGDPLPTSPHDISNSDTSPELPTESPSDPLILSPRHPEATNSPSISARSP